MAALSCWLCRIFVLCGLAAATSVSQAATPLPQVSAGQIQRLSAITSQWVPARTVDVWLPAGYPAKQPYAVLYMHDGQMLFDATHNWNKQEWQVDEVAQQVQDQGLTKPFIVVAIHNAGAHRHSEYFPQKPFEALPSAVQQQQYQLKRQQDPLFAGKIYSDGYLKFITQELKPAIDQNFAVARDPANTLIMGSSMGGLISWYALMEYPSVFGGAAALSTHWPGSFNPQDNPLPAAFFQYIQQSLPKLTQHRVYFDHGDQTLDAWYPPLQQQVDQLFQQASYPASQWQSLFFPGTDHSENAWSARLDKPLIFLLKP